MVELLQPGPTGHTRRDWLAAVAPIVVVLSACGEASGGAIQAVSAPAATPEPKELIVLAASSLTDAFTELGDDFPKQPGSLGVKLTFGFGASSQLRTQLEQGAPADVFASADTIQMDAAVKAGMLQGVPALFANNRLVVIVPKDNRAGVNALADLAKPGLKLVTTSRDVPVGSYTRQALEKMAADPQYGTGFDQRVLANVVSEEANVRQVATKVQLGEADVGVCYTTDVTPKVTSDLRTIEIPEKFNTIAPYPIAVAKFARAPATAARFVQYVRAGPGQGILKKYGFLPVG